MPCWKSPGSSVEHYLKNGLSAHTQKCCSISSGWLVMLKPPQKLVISLNLPWHRDAIREPCAGILIEAAKKGD